MKGISLVNLVRTYDISLSTDYFPNCKIEFFYWSQFQPKMQRNVRNTGRKLGSSKGFRKLTWTCHEVGSGSVLVDKIYPTIIRFSVVYTQQFVCNAAVHFFSIARVREHLNC